MPETFYEVASRVDHIISALLPENINKLNISDHVNVSVKLPTDESETTRIVINNISASVPLSYELNYGNMDQILVDYGMTSICSLYRNNLNTFAQKSFELSEATRLNNSLGKEVLFAAECSVKPRLAIFVEFLNGTNKFAQVKVYTAGHFFTIRAENEPVIAFNDRVYNIRDSSFEYPQMQSDFKCVNFHFIKL